MMHDMGYGPSGEVPVKLTWLDLFLHGLYQGGLMFYFQPNKKELFSKIDMPKESTYIAVFCDIDENC